MVKKTPENPEPLRKRVKAFATAKKGGGRAPQQPLAGKVTDRDLQIYHMFVGGMRKRHIAIKLREEGQSVDHAAVHRAIKRVSEHLQQEFMDEIRSMRVEHTMRLQNIAEEAMEAWEKSKQPGVVETVTQGMTDKDGEPADTIKTQKTYQIGNVSYLGEARTALSEIRKIWGVDAKNLGPDAEEQGERVAGQSREDAIQQQIERLHLALSPGVN